MVLPIVTLLLFSIWWHLIVPWTMVPKRAAKGALRCQESNGIEPNSSEGSLRSPERLDSFKCHTDLKPQGS